MNKIVREHYPVERLPQDLRLGLPEGTSVTVVVTAEPADRVPLTREQAVAVMRQMQKENIGKGVTAEEAAREIRELRDEWDD